MAGARCSRLRDSGRAVFGGRPCNPLFLQAVVSLVPSVATAQKSGVQSSSDSVETSRRPRGRFRSEGVLAVFIPLIDTN